MNKIIFQIGLLAFCVASVIYSSRGDDVLHTIAQAFIIFMVVVCAIAALLFVASAFSARNPDRSQRPASPEQPAETSSQGTV